MTNRSFLTLLLVLAIAHFAPVAVPGANALQGMNLAPPAVPRRAEHINMAARMIKKRQGPGGNRPTDTDTNTNTNTGTTTGNQQTRTTTESSPSPTNTQTTTPSQTSTTDTNTRTTSTTPTSTTPSPTTNPPANTSTPTSEPSRTSAPTSQRTTNTVTSTRTSAAAQTSDQSSDRDASFLPKPAIIGLIVTGSCIAAAAAIWTIIRKWKFSPSRHFEDRLEPINWEPTQSSGLPHDPTVAALARGTSQNGRSARGSLSSDERGSVRNMSSANHDQVSMAPDFPPPHDFTAGAAQLGPSGGYVDMHRGPSPNPYAPRGVSPAPGQYGQQYETPNPYDAYDYNAGYNQRRY